MLTWSESPVQKWLNILGSFYHPTRQSFIPRVGSGKGATHTFYTLFVSLSISLFGAIEKLLMASLIFSTLTVALNPLLQVLLRFGSWYLNSSFWNFFSVQQLVLAIQNHGFKELSALLTYKGQINCSKAKNVHLCSLWINLILRHKVLFAAYIWQKNITKINWKILHLL